MTEHDRLTQAHQLIQSAHRPLLICHVSPDADAIGSVVGLGRALQQIGKLSIPACSDRIPSRFEYIPGAEDIVQQVSQRESTSFDLVISLDCSDLDRLGCLAQTPGFGDVPLLNVDHHRTNTGFGDVDLVDPDASSTAEMVLRLLDSLGVPLDVGIATSLLAGMAGDTRGFRTSNVTVRVMEATLRLMKAGASLPHIAQYGLDRRSTAEARLWGVALSQLQVDGRIAWTSIPLAARRAAGCTCSGDAGLVSFLVGAEEADLAVVFVETQGGGVEVGLRAVPGFDVAQVALQFGGGGHALAAGCELPGPLEEAQTRLLTALRADLARRDSPG